MNHLAKFVRRLAPRALGLTVVISLAFATGVSPGQKPIRADGGSSPLTQQLTQDLVGAGVSVGAALSGSVPLAFLAGYLGKYIATYGVQGIKSIVDYVKGYGPQDLSEVNLLYIYLMNAKRNLYQAMIDIRKAVEQEDPTRLILREIDRVEQSLREQCSAPPQAGQPVPPACDPGRIDPAYVNTQFLNILIDARESIHITRDLSAREIKNTYQYVMLLYLDLVIVEQRLIQAQASLLADRASSTIELLKSNPYLSNEEKDYQSQIVLNIVLRWLRLADTRRATAIQALAGPLAQLERDNADLQREIDEYRRRHADKSLEFVDTKSERDDYEAHLRRIQAELAGDRMRVDPFAQNPFQTGTALSGYFLNERTLLLERDAFFQMKANKLQTTEDVADYQHRVKVLRTHGNNILLQLVQAMADQSQDGMGSVEPPKNELTLERLIEQCKQDAACVADRLNRPETALSNILIDNLRLASKVFKDVPYMNVLEVNAIYQLVQLISLEVMHGQNQLSRVEFEIFNSKQESVIRAVRDNSALSGTERAFQVELIRSTVNEWKKRILQKRYDHREEFRKQAGTLLIENQGLVAALKKLRSNLFAGEKGGCFFLAPREGRRDCRNEKNLLKRLRNIEAGRTEFAGVREEKLPDEFWRGI